MPAQQYRKEHLCPKCKTRYLMRDGRTPRGDQRWACKYKDVDRGDNYCYNTTDPTAPYRGQDARPKEGKRNLKHRVKIESLVLVVTWAQNATPVNRPLLQSLLTFCNHRNAQLVVIAGRYKNPTSQWTEAQENAEVWADEVTPYLHNQRKKLNANITLAADIKTQPTAVSPLIGFEGLTHGESCIIGHPKLQLSVIPSPQHRLPKILTTTGSVTAPNYTDSRAGKLGEFHHSPGAAVVEIVGGKFHLRHIIANKGGEFIDLDTHYSPDGTKKAQPALGLVMGDAHYRFADPAAVRGTFGPGGLVERLNPKTLVWHDVLDSYAVNPHHKGNPFVAIAKERAGFNVIEREVRETIEWIERCTGERESIIVPSNHDDMLARWIMSNDWRLDPQNSEFYLRTALHIAEGAQIGSGGAEYVDAFKFWVERMKRPGSDVRALLRNESFTIAGIECGLHGDVGPNGVRGTVRNLRRIGVKVISGHGHTPAIDEGHYRVGTMTGKLEYQKGPSGWMNTHCSIDALGKRHLHHIIGGRFTEIK